MEDTNLCTWIDLSWIENAKLPTKFILIFVISFTYKICNSFVLSFLDYILFILFWNWLNQISLNILLFQY